MACAYAVFKTEATKTSSNFITGMCAHNLTNRRNPCTHLIQVQRWLEPAAFVFINLHVFQESNPSLQTLQPNDLFCAGMLAPTPRAQTQFLTFSSVENEVLLKRHASGDQDWAALTAAKSGSCQCLPQLFLLCLVTAANAASCIPHISETSTTSENAGR